MTIARFLKSHPRVFLDSMVFIYFFEGFEEKRAELAYLFERIEQGGNTAFTSSLTLSEVLVKPYKVGALGLVDEYIRFFNEFPHLTISPLSQEIAIQAPKVRASSRLKTPDAIQVASAVESRLAGFITADKKLTYQGITFFYL